MRRPLKITLWVAIAIWLIAMVGTAPEIATAVRQKRNVERTFVSFSSALVSNNLETAYEFSGSEFRSKASLSDFTGHQEALQKRFGKLNQIKEQSIRINVHRSPPIQTAVIAANHEYETQTLAFVYEFHYEDGKWKLYGYKEM